MIKKNTAIFIFTACAITYLLGMFCIRLMDIDAAQYASISREMLECKSYLQFFDLGNDYLDKPPMLFWLSGLSMKIFGVHLREQGGEVPIHGWVLNPLGHQARAVLGLVTPYEGWAAAPVEISLGAREKCPFMATLVVPHGTQCRRMPIALDLTVDGRPFGQVAEAWVTAGHDSF